MAVTSCDASREVGVSDVLDRRRNAFLGAARRRSRHGGWELHRSFEGDLQHPGWGVLARYLFILIARLPWPTGQPGRVP